jgi:hypothetical protein
MKPERPSSCTSCERELPLTFHHLVPKKMHEKYAVKQLHGEKELIHYGVWLCKDCHKKIHRTFSHTELALNYYTLDALLQHTDFSKFVKWVSKQRKPVKRAPSKPRS